MPRFCLSSARPRPEVAPGAPLPSPSSYPLRLGSTMVIRIAVSSTSSDRITAARPASKSAAVALV